MRLRISIFRAGEEDCVLWLGFTRSNCAATHVYTGLKDSDVLAVAGRDERVLVTHDYATMPKHFEEFIRTTASPGFLVIPQSLAVRDVQIASVGSVFCGPQSGDSGSPTIPQSGSWPALSFETISTD